MPSGDGPLTSRRVLLAVAGGVAAYKAATLARELQRAGATVQAVLTPAAARFVGPATFEGITGRPAPTEVFAEAHRTPHLALAREADVAVYAPATANLLAKLAHGLADDMPSATFTCLSCPVVIAPAMHTEMWHNPANQDNIATLRTRGAHIVGPEEGELAGGEEGIGRLADEHAIVAAVTAALRPLEGPLSGQRAVVTAGGTREPVDPVRFLGNRSSGKMGYAVAEALARRGADVDLVAASSALPDPPGVTVTHVETALEMREAVHALAAGARVVVKAAAVADFRPAAAQAQKIKKEAADPPTLELVRNPDILAELGADKGDRVLVGFAAETDDAEARGKAKLAAKALDLVVVNDVSAADAGFGVDTNRAVILDADGGRIDVGLASKAAVADAICDAVEARLVARG